MQSIGGILSACLYIGAIVYILLSDAPHWAKALTLVIAIGLGALLKKPAN